MKAILISLFEINEKYLPNYSTYSVLCSKIPKTPADLDIVSVLGVEKGFSTRVNDYMSNRIIESIKKDDSAGKRRRKSSSIKKRC